MADFNRDEDQTLESASAEAMRKFKRTKTDFFRAWRGLMIAGCLIGGAENIGLFEKQRWMGGVFLISIVGFCFYWRHLKKISNFWGDEYAGLERERDGLRRKAWLDE